MNQDLHNAASVGLFAGFLSLLDSASPAKLITAFLIAVATGGGYKLGSWAVSSLIQKLAQKRAMLRRSPTQSERDK